METESILHELSQSVNFPGFFIQDVRLGKDGELQLMLGRRFHAARCSCCGLYRGTFYDSKWRSFRDFDWGSRRVYIRIQRVRVNCPLCGIRVEKLPFAMLNSPLTERFCRFLGELCRFVTRSDVAFLYGVSEDTVGHCEWDVLTRRYRKPEDLDGLKLLRLDEIARKKGHNYLTVLVNHETGKVVEVVEGRKKDDLEPFFIRLGQQRRALIEAVCIDMSRSYIAAIEYWCPDAKLIFDRFHVVKHLNEALDTIRKLFIKQNPQEEKEQWRHSKRALGKNKENLTIKEAQRLDWIEEKYPELFTVYTYKVEFQQLWEYPTKRGAENFLTRWLKKARSLGYQALEKFCNMIERHREGIMNYYFYPMTNGAQEGLNNKLNVIRRKAYGYQDMLWFSLKIHQATSPRQSPFCP